MKREKEEQKKKGEKEEEEDWKEEKSPVLFISETVPFNDGRDNWFPYHGEDAEMTIASWDPVLKIDLTSIRLLAAARVAGGRRAQGHSSHSEIQYIMYIE
jgi:hypothetical protein